MLFVENVAQEFSVVEKHSFFQFKWSNDFVFHTDYYYTNGFSFEILGEWGRKNPIYSILISTSDNSIEQYGITIAQDIFTPQERYNIEKQLDGDRPFAADLLLGFVKKTFDQKNEIKIISEIQIGVVGSAAMGKETQDRIHDLTPTSKRLNGWDNQISNSIALQYSFDGYKTLMKKHWWDISSYGKGKIGIPYTSIEVGGELRIGHLDYFPREFEIFSRKNWITYFFAEASAKIVGYNATLQGGLVSNSVYTIDKINNFLGCYKFGIYSKYRLISAEIGANFNTPEFPGALSHRLAYMKIQFGF